MTQPHRERRQFQAAGLPAHEWEAPGGRTVVALAGIGSSGVVWSDLADALPDARVLSVDLHGRGQAQHVPGPHGLRAHARDVAAVLDELNLTDVVIVGHSMGAYLAPLVAQEAKGRVARLVLIDGGVPADLPFFMRPLVTRLAWKLQGKRNAGPFPSIEECVEKSFRKPLGAHGAKHLELILTWMAYELEHKSDGFHLRADVAHLVDDAVDTFHGERRPGCPDCAVGASAPGSRAMASR